MRGKKLGSVQDKMIRPTADRLRESIFNILSLRVPDSVVLDLFAGTGALGIEALSRGAKSAVFIDLQKSALSVIKRNLVSCTLDNSASIIRWDVKQNLNCLINRKPAFNLVFLDPPYNQRLVEPALSNLDKSRSLEDKACIVVEHAPLEPIPTDFSAFNITDQRRYGKTLVSFLNYVL